MFFHQSTIIAFHQFSATDIFTANISVFALQISQICLCSVTAMIMIMAHHFLIHFACMCVCWSLRYRSREWAAACPSPPAEAELVTVYWLSNIWCLQGVCSRWSKLAEWLWQTHSVRCCCKVNNNIKPSQTDFRFSGFFLFFSFFYNLQLLWLEACHLK